MQKIKYNTEEGFSLTEIMVAVALLGMVSLAAYSLYITAFESLNKGENRIETHTELENISNELVANLRNTTNLNLLSGTIDEDTTQFAYIMQEGNQIVMYERDNSDDATGDFEPELRTVIGDILENPEKGEQEYNYELEFTSDDKMVSYSLGLEETNLAIESDIYAQNLDEAIANNSGEVLEFVPLEEDEIDDRSKDTNMFWLNFVMSAYSDTLEVVKDGIEFAQRTDGEELAVGIDGDGNTLGGIMFKKMTNEYFNDNRGTLDSYSVIIDAQMEKPGDYTGPLGYGVLLRGIYKGQDEKDYGYMLQFDPGANGLVVRRIRGGDSNGDKHIGAYLYDDGNTNISPEHGGLYTTYELENDEFIWDSNSNSDDEDGYYGWDQWFERYKTKIKVQTQPNGDLIIRASLIDEAGNQSNEVWFGDFNAIETNESKFYGGDRGDWNNYGDWAQFERGKKLDWDYFEDHGAPEGELPGRYFALRSWSGDGFEVNFFEIEIAGAEPGVKNVEVNNLPGNSGDEVILEFDEALWFDGADLELGTNISKSDFEFGNGADIAEIDVNSNKRKLIFKTEDSVDNVKLKYTVPDDEDLALEDSQGNQVNSFTVDLDLGGLVQ